MKYRMASRGIWPWVGCSVAILAIVGACAGRSTPPTSQGGVASVPHTSSSAPESTPVPKSRFGYAHSPITDFADEVTALALAALEGKPLPKVSFPLWAGDFGHGSAKQETDGTETIVETTFVADGNDLLEITERRQTGQQKTIERRVVGKVDVGQVKGDKVALPVEVLGFFLQLDAALGDFPRNPTENETGVVLQETILYLSKKGLQIAHYEVREAWGRAHPLPPTLSALDDAIEPLLDAIRAGEVPKTSISKEQIEDLGGWAKRELEVRDMGERATFRVRLKRFEGKVPTGYGLEHINIMVVDANGSVRYLRLAGHGGRKGFTLRRLPLVRVSDTPDF